MSNDRRMVLGFDFDGTLVTSWTAEPLPGVCERLAALPGNVKTFIATNQAGPVYRAVIGDVKYPSIEDVAGNIANGLRRLNWRPDLLLIAVHPGKGGDAWQEAAEDVSIGLRDAIIRANIGLAFWAVYGRPRYRKPDRGMLNDAIVFFSALPDDVLYVGDMESDRAAARIAGTRYLDAAVWRAEGSSLFTEIG
jgi:hypothetical protein